MENVKSVATTITLYGDRAKQLQRLCIENGVSATAFYNTIIEAFVEGTLNISDTGTNKRRIDKQDDIFDQLRFTILDSQGKQLY